MRLTIVTMAPAWLPRRPTAAYAVVQVIDAGQAHCTACGKVFKDYIRKCLSGVTDPCWTLWASRSLALSGTSSKVRADACPLPARP